MLKCLIFFLLKYNTLIESSQVALVVKSPLANAGDMRLGFSP